MGWKIFNDNCISTISEISNKFRLTAFSFSQGFPQVKPFFRSKRGTMMLMLLVALGVAGMIAGRVLPRQEVIAQKAAEDSLRVNLAEIRQAFDLKTLVDGTFNPDLSTPEKIRQTLEGLKNDKLLRSDELDDPTMFSSSWNTGTMTYWLGVPNFLFNTSLESSLPPAPSEVVSSWSCATTDTSAATDTTFWPSSNSSEFDDYKGQNKMGKKLTIFGSSLKITK